MNGALVIVELANGKPTTASLELLALARSIPDIGVVAAMSLGADATTAQILIARGADTVFVSSVPADADYNSDVWTSCAEGLARELNSSLIVATHNRNGSDIAPRLAFRLGGRCATGCVAVAEDNDGELIFSRSSHGGKVCEVISFKLNLAVATVQTGIWYEPLPADAARQGTIVTLTEMPSTRIRCVERHRDTSSALRLEDARVIVAGGRGLNGPEGFNVLEPLAKTLGGVVGASRVPCDLGWCSHAMQIGLTGKTVTPDLYIAVGISGASHHLAGCGNAKTIVAINTDVDAAIFRDAKYGVVGDFAKVIPALTAAIRALPDSS